MAIGSVLAIFGGVTVGIAVGQEPNRAAEECLEQIVGGEQDFDQAQVDRVIADSQANNDENNDENDDQNNDDQNNDDQNNDDQNNDDQNDQQNQDQQNADQQDADQQDADQQNADQQNADQQDADQQDADQNKDGDRRNSATFSRYLGADSGSWQGGSATRVWNVSNQRRNQDQQNQDQDQQDQNADQQNQDQQNQDQDQQNQDQDQQDQNADEQNQDQQDQNADEQNQDQQDQNADEQNQDENNGDQNNEDCTDIIAEEARKAVEAFDPAREKFDNAKGQLLRYEQTFPENEADAPDDAEETLAKDLDDVKQIVADRSERLRRAPRGQFRNQCTISHRNTDNSWVAPDVIDAAQHVHDYYGNSTQNAFSTAENLLADEQSEECAQPADRSSYVWPMITRGGDNNEVVDPGTVQFQFRGYNNRNVGQVAPMPLGLKLVTGAAKNLDPAKSAAKWACTGSENETSVDFPTCEGGSQLVRIADFPSCWDGENLDSADHKTHVVFPEDSGECPESNNVPLPRLRMRAVYQQLSGNPDAFFLSSFPQSLGLAVSDHFDALNLMDPALMRKGVDCINQGRNCGIIR